MIRWFITRRSGVARDVYTSSSWNVILDLSRLDWVLVGRQEYDYIIPCDPITNEATKQLKKRKKKEEKIATAYLQRVLYCSEHFSISFLLRLQHIDYFQEKEERYSFLVFEKFLWKRSRQRYEKEEEEEKSRSCDVEWWLIDGRRWQRGRHWTRGGGGGRRVYADDAEIPRQQAARNSKMPLGRKEKKKNFFFSVPGANKVFFSFFFSLLENK